jgi:putative membrane protein insertion efficiency factor
MPNRNPLISLVLIIYALLFSGFILNSTPIQASTELDFILSANPISEDSTKFHPESHLNIRRVSELGLLFKETIGFYQRFISTQDVPSCNFTPTCSQFSLESVNKLGILRGILLTSDRLQRCNSMSKSRYGLDYESGNLKDPVELYIKLLK